MNPAIYGKTASILRHALDQADKLDDEGTGTGLNTRSGVRTVQLIAAELADMFEIESERFDRAAFLKSCLEPDVERKSGWIEWGYKSHPRIEPEDLKATWSQPDVRPVK